MDVSQTVLWMWRLEVLTQKAKRAEGVKGKEESTGLYRKSAAGPSAL